jgi:hypothetical protein
MGRSLIPLFDLLFKLFNKIVNQKMEIIGGIYFINGRVVQNKFLSYWAMESSMYEDLHGVTNNETRELEDDVLQLFSIKIRN